MIILKTENYSIYSFNFFNKIKHFVALGYVDSNGAKKYKTDFMRR